MTTDHDCDLLVIGGGINGAGIARDAAGRGLSVMLVEKDDLAGHTSSASTKLIHGGLRYLEYGELRLVRESLRERERLLAIAPHIIWPLRFALPQTASPRPAWMVRVGLFLYDHIGGRRSLPGTQTVNLRSSSIGDGLSNRNGKAFLYSDCWVQDARLVVLNAMDAAERGARIETRTRFVSAARDGGKWTAIVADDTGTRRVAARAIVNAAGPWVSDVLRETAGVKASGSVRLVKGSHIVLPRLYEGDHAFMLQNDDRRIVFAIPYEGEFTLVGTTEQPWAEDAAKARIDHEEIAYLLDTANRYFRKQSRRGDIVWTYSGIRPLFDDRTANASAVTRDYVLETDRGPDGTEPAILSVFGGKITTYRRLAEHAMQELGDDLPTRSGAWTQDAPLPGGDIPNADFDGYLAWLCRQYPAMPQPLLHRLARAYGTRTENLLGDATDPASLGTDLGGGLYEAELRYLVAHEWAKSSDDVLWRRGKMGLHTPLGTAARIDAAIMAMHNPT